jgi:predicted heme/steroid binding protein
MKKDDPMEDLKVKSPEEEDESNLPTYTASELLEFGDGLDGRPILISIFGRVYDVSKGKRFYGQGGAYSQFAGHDVTYSLSTGCRTQECVEMSAKGLEEKEMNEGKRWLSFFHLHDKYPLVGKMEKDYVEILLSDLLVSDEAIVDEDGATKQKKPPILQH